MTVVTIVSVISVCAMVVMRAMITINIGIVSELLKCLGAEQARNQRAQQWQEENCLNHDALQPFIKLISSTAMEPRLR